MSKLELIDDRNNQYTEIDNIAANFCTVSNWTQEVFLARLEAIWPDESIDAETRHYAAEVHRGLGG